MVDYLNKLVMRRDGTVAMVTDISDGWLLLDGDVDDSALPDEVHIVNLSVDDHIITDIALSFGIDPLQARRVPDLARQRVAQSRHAYSALQVIPHPTIEKAYLTIKGVHESRYSVTVKPEKGSSYELLLSEKSIQKFEREGILPMKDAEVNHKPGDVVSIGTKIVILKEKLEADWTYTDPMTGKEGAVALSANLVAQPQIVTDAINHLYEETVRNQANVVKQSSIDSLRSENSSLHKQLDAANNLLRANEAEADDAEAIKKQLTQSQSATKKAEEALIEMKNLHDDLQEQFVTLKEQAAKENLELMRLRKESQNHASSVAVNGTKPAKKEYECKIIDNTGEGQFEDLWSNGWTCYHTQFTHDGKVRSIWKRYNAQDQLPDDTLEEENTLEAFDKALYDGVPVPETIEINMAVPAVATPPANNLQLGKYGQAIATHGLEKTKEGMNAEVQLAVLSAIGELENRPITQFLPSPEGVQS